MSWPYLKIVAGPLPSPPAEAPVPVSTSETAITFKWSASPDESAAALMTNYYIFDGDTQIATVDSDTVEYTYTSVVAGESYLISIQSVSLVGESEIRSLATVVWAVEAPDAPVISITDTSRDSCSVAWTALSPPTNSLITGYVILIDDGASGEFREAYDGRTKPSTVDATIYGLTSKTTYQLTGYGINKAGNGANATQITCHTATVPGVPGTPSWISSTASSIEVEWEPAYDDGGSPIMEYQLYVDEVEGLDVANVESWVQVYSGSALTYDVTSSLTATMAYRFKVKTVSEQYLESEFSSVAIFYAAPLPPQVTFETTDDAHLETSRVSIWLTWVQPTLSAAELAIDGYLLYWDGGIRSSGNFTQLARLDSYDQNFFNVTGGLLTTGHTYRFQVSAINTVGEGPLSDEVEARAKALPGQPTLPERQSSVVVTDGGGAQTTSITLRWYSEDVVDTGGVPLTGFKLYQFVQVDETTTADPSTATLAFDGTDQPDVTEYTVTGLVVDTDYSFFVTALNADEGPQSDSLTLRAAAFPEAPSDLAETADSRTGTAIGLEWTAPTDGGSAILSYTLAIVRENEEDQVVYYGSATSTVLEGLTAGVEYEFKILATTAVGDSTWSTNKYKFLIVDLPSPPLDLQLIAFDDTLVSVKWQPPISSGGQPSSGFKVYRENCDEATTTVALLATLPASQYQYTDTGVTGGTNYTYTVTAYNVLGGEGDPSLGLPIIPAREPDATLAPALVGKGKDFITIDWVAPGWDGGEEITKYILYIKADYDASYQQIYAGVALEFKVSAEQFPSILKEGFYYQFKVRSVNSRGLSPLSVASAQMIAAQVPSAPQNLTLLSRSSTSLIFSWEPPLDFGGVALLGYNVYVAAGNAAYAQVSDADSTSDPTIFHHEHIAADLTPGESYRFKVSAHNLIGEGLTSQLRTGQELHHDVVDYVLAADLPEAPANPPTVETTTENAITITLEEISTANAGGSAITGYLVEIDDGLGGGTGFRQVHDSLTTSLIIGDLFGGRAYQIRYAGRNLVYDSGNMFECDFLKWSEPREVLTAVVPLSPVNLRQMPATNTTDALLRYRAKLVVEWDPLTEAQLGSSELRSYTVAILDVDGTALETEVTVSAQTTAHMFEYLDDPLNTLPLIPGQDYTFRVKATNFVGPSEWSDSTVALNPGVEPTRPGLITFTSTTRTTITYSFEGLTGEDTGGSVAYPIPITYHVFISKNNGTDWELLTSPSNAVSQTAEYLSPGHVYYFKYQGENDIGLFSEFSTAHWMLPGQTPSAPSEAPILVTHSSENITLRVPAPADTGGPPVSIYEIEVS